MSDEIFLIRNGRLQELRAEPYDSEELLQKLLEDHPNLISGSQVDGDSPRRWLLVSREMGVPGEEGGGNRWALDHLFLDQDGIPTLVEVKRSSDTRIRREIVGQMLDYAAGAVAYWPVEEIRSRFVARCEIVGRDPDDILDIFLEDTGEVEGFWSKVKINLQAGKVRLIFVADQIPAELRRIVEFLNWQMDPAEVLALEIKQFVGEGLRTLVPRVLGQSAEAQHKRVGDRPQRLWDEESFFAELTAQAGGEISSIGRRLFDWAADQDFEFTWGKGQNRGSVGASDRTSGLRLFYLWTSGKVSVPFAHLNKKPPFDHEDRLKEFRDRINAVHGMDLGDDALQQTWTERNLGLLEGDEAISTYLQALEWALSEIRKANGL